ncbi:MAG: hypothetical protein RR086_01750 [Clostridia bacterium]
MTKKQLIIFAIVFTVIFTLTASCAVGGSGGFFNVETGKRFTFTVKQEEKRFVYICGAVEKEGYYSFVEGKTYIDVISMAKAQEDYFHENWYDEEIDYNIVEQIIVNFTIDGHIAYVVNVNNSIAVANCDYLTVAQKTQISQYIDKHGVITNLSQLSDTLVDYHTARGRLYVDKDEYEEIS